MPKLPPQLAYHEIYLYSLKDITSDSFGPLMEARSDDQARRAVLQHVSLEPTTLFAMYPNDYQLWRIGILDRNSGAIQSVPEYICSVSSLTPPVEKAA